jgi:hypothetical protein
VNVITGAEDLHKASKLQHDLIALWKKGGFHLRELSADHPKLLEGIPPEVTDT